MGNVTTHVPQVGDQPLGVLGNAGDDQTGPSVTNIVIPAWRYIGVEVLWVFLTVFFGIVGSEGIGLTDYVPAGTALNQMTEIASLAIGPSILMLGKELLDYLGKVRAARA